MTISTNKREEWIDVAKVITMLLVVISHSSYYNINSYFGGIHYDNDTFNHSFTYRVIDWCISFIYMFHMPFFMAISGMTYALSYKPNKTIPILIRDKANRLLFPMLMVTLFLSIPFKFISGYWDLSTNKFIDIILGQVLLFGNTHMWFLASLFNITIIFTFLYQKNKIKSNSIIFWLILTIISYLGIFLSHRGQYLGIPGAMKNFIFFSTGFCFFSKIQNIRPKAWYILMGWIIMAIIYFLCLKFAKYLPQLNEILYVPIAFLGCYNMIVTTKFLLQKTRITNTPVYKTLHKNSYDIYLYSDPFNYLLILLILYLFGDNTFTGNLDSFIAFLIRIILSLLLSYLVIYIMNVIRPKRIP